MVEKKFSNSYYDIEWDSDQFSKPWRDSEFLQEVYELDEKPTQQEIADKIGCSAQTVNRYMPDDAQRGGEGLPYTDIAMFSGGYDSLVATHYSMTVLDCDAVLHIDTQTGINENRQFVEDVCEWFGWKLEVVTPNKTLEEFAKEFGFPKAPAHSWIYRYLKEHPLSSFVTDIEDDKPTFYTGVRKDESARRMENVSSERQEQWGGRWWWEAPIADFSTEDIMDYIVEHGLPRNPVGESIGRSGECFCGAYADRFSELLTLKEDYPDHYQWIMETEERVQEDIGTEEDHCYWGTSGMSSDDLQSLMDGEDAESDMLMCVDCEGEGHRSFGHNMNPTYESIYVAGPKEGYEQFYNTATQYDQMVDWVNPFELNNFTDENEAYNNAEQVYGMDTDALRQTDAVLVRRVDKGNLCGASIEAAIATESVGIPVVVYNDADTNVPTMLKGLATEVVDDKKSAIERVCSHAKQKLLTVDGVDNILVK